VCRRNDESYIGQIDLEDIRVICNRAVTSPGWSTTAMESGGGVVVNAGMLEKQHAAAGTAMLNNHRSNTDVIRLKRFCPVFVGVFLETF